MAYGDGDGDGYGEGGLRTHVSRTVRDVVLRISFVANVLRTMLNRVYKTRKYCQCFKLVHFVLINLLATIMLSCYIFIKKDSIVKYSLRYWFLKLTQGDISDCGGEMRPGDVSEMSARHVFFLRLHNCRPRAIKNFYAMLETLPRGRLYVVFDDTKFAAESCHLKLPIVRLSDNISMTGPAILQVNLSDFQKRNKLHKDERYLSTTLAFIYENLRVQYDYAWIIEADVYCNGRWLKTLAIGADTPGDLLASHLPSQFAGSLNWPLWDVVDWAIPVTARYSAFLPIARFSRHFMRIVSRNCGKIDGHLEVYLPTLCHHCGCILGMLPPAMLGHIGYEVHNMSIRFPLSNTENKLYHPVKD